MLDGFLDQGGHRLSGVRRAGSSENLRLGEGRGRGCRRGPQDAPATAFPDAEVELLAGIMPALTLVFMLRTIQQRGAHADHDISGERCRRTRAQAGNIVRGRAQPIRAASSGSARSHQVSRASPTPATPDRSARPAQRLAPKRRSRKSKPMGGTRPQVHGRRDPGHFFPTTTRREPASARSTPPQASAAGSPLSTSDATRPGCR